MTRAREPHAWNTGFRWSLPDREPTTISVAQRDQFDRDGFFVLRNAIDAGSMAEVEAACAEGVAVVSGLLEQIGGRLSVAGADAI